MSHYDLVLDLTSSPLPQAERARVLNDFAYELGWQPSDHLDDPNVSGFANAHLVVEHGLENTAVISFLRRPRTFSDLTSSERESLLAISYNNLVDWHINIEVDEISVVFNRTKPAKVVAINRISRDNYDYLRSDAFEKIAGKRPNPNVPTLDDALMRTISYWKRLIPSEIAIEIPNECLSALFNAIIFVRAVEDNYRRYLHGEELTRRKENQGLLQILSRSDQTTVRMTEIFQETFKLFSPAQIPDYILDNDKLSVFDKLNKRTIYSLFADFYRNRFAPYPYDFSVMSKHALSRIYEHYVSILRLRTTDSSQLSFLPSIPEEELDKSFGSIYTPQFIARFFAKYIRENIPPSAYRRLRVIDPACGSGIFLRTHLELQCDPMQNGITTDLIQKMFDNAVGIDIDENACQATRLSLALLHLVLTDSFPKTLGIFSVDAVDYYQNNLDLDNSFDVVFANPPFVSLEFQPASTRTRLSDFLSDYSKGRKDLYLAFLLVAIKILKPGGFGLFVLPHSFLLSKSAMQVRELLSETCWIRCLADLSAIRVFQDYGSYVILLVFQKKSTSGAAPPLATVTKCQDFVGLALQDVVESRSRRTDFYNVYTLDQETFKEKEWLVLPPTEATIERKFRRLPTIDEFMEVRQGLITGLDDVFMLTDRDLNRLERQIFVPFLHDREIQRYSLPVEPSHYVFYPYVNGRNIDERELKRDFPNTWAYLLSHKERLRSRSPVRKGQLEWWRPVRPRHPKSIMRPKIVTPHLVFTPRFGLDSAGMYAVSHSPFLYPKIESAQYDLLRFFTAILNSTPCYWYIATHSHVYQKGYTMLEVKTLRRTPVPDPASLSPVVLRRLLNLIDSRVVALSNLGRELDKQIDNTVADLYGLSRDERIALGMEE